MGGLLLTVFGLVMRKSKRTRETELADVKRNVRDDLVALGEDIRAMELDVQMPGADPEAVKAYGDAVGSYERANRAFETARSTRDLKPAAEALAEGRYAMTWAREVLAGRTPPERRPPCFFDPRHGPSTRDVMWARPPPPRDAARGARLRGGRPARRRAARSRARARSRTKTAVAFRTGRPARRTRPSTVGSSPAS